MLLPQFEIRDPRQHVAAGHVTKRDKVEQPWKDRSLVNIGPQFKGYPEDQLETIPSLEIQTLQFSAIRKPSRRSTNRRHVCRWRPASITFWTSAPT